MKNKEHKIKVIIVDDSSEFIKGLSFFLVTQLNCNVVGTAANGLELLSHPLLHTADILFIDCEMPIMNGIEAAIHINYKYPRMNMIAITMYEDSVYLDDITSVGFKGYVHKTEINTKLEAVMAQVLELDTEKKQ